MNPLRIWRSGIGRRSSAFESVIIAAMSTNHEQFVVDESGNKTAVLIDIARYSELIEAEEELEVIRAYDEAKAANDEEIPFAQAIREIEAS